VVKDRNYIEFIVGILVYKQLRDFGLKLIQSIRALIQFNMILSSAQNDQNRLLSSKQL
jgi:hypothetical protein